MPMQVGRNHRRLSWYTLLEVSQTASDMRVHENKGACRTETPPSHRVPQPPRHLLRLQNRAPLQTAGGAREDLQDGQDRLQSLLHITRTMQDGRPQEVPLPRKSCPVPILWPVRPARDLWQAPPHRVHRTYNLLPGLPRAYVCGGYDWS